ncbi:preprotein translocase subunit SecG [Candidatus Epulonipiscium viviparus]|nr:preprotein translocase subunit SecG [Candidatus Epulopiscium viviparus]
MEMFRTILTIIFVIASFAIIIIVLMQEGKSTGLSGMTGESENTFWAQNKKNSLEGKIERFTKVTAAIFMISALILGII